MIAALLINVARGLLPPSADWIADVADAVNDSWKQLVEAGADGWTQEDDDLIAGAIMELPLPIDDQDKRKIADAAAVGVRHALAGAQAKRAARRLRLFPNGFHAVSNGARRSWRRGRPD